MRNVEPSVPWRWTATAISPPAHRPGTHEQTLRTRGDSSIIGAGTYADNRSVAVSATGTGEMFIRTVAAFNTATQVRLQHIPIAEAADITLAEIAAIGGDGGLILLDKRGNYAMRFNTIGMYRGTIGKDGIAWMGVFRKLFTRSGLQCAPS